jgi:hypothetical protein
MQKYKVTYAGLPRSSRTVEAASPKEAALAFFQADMYRNGVIVRCSMFREVAFPVEELLAGIPDVRPESLPLAIVKEADDEAYDPSKDPFVWATRLVMIVFAGGIFWFAYRLLERGAFILAPILVGVAGLVQLVFALSASSKTLARLGRWRDF